MSRDSFPSEWIEPFDLFVSYARRDDEAGMVSALVEAIEADFARFAPGVPLRVFFDKKSILDMQHWQGVLKRGLRQSKVMVAVLSEDYFRSEWCRKEWEEYVLVEQSRTYPGEAVSPIFVVAPAELDKLIPPEAREWWRDVTGRNAVVEVHPYWPLGRDAIRAALLERVQSLGKNIRDRVEHGRLLAQVPRHPMTRNPNFVGRREELGRLRDLLSRYEMAGVCAVNGVGGIGKSSVAREYAFLFRKEYLGGQFEIDLANVDSVAGVAKQLVRIARDYLEAAIPPTIDADEQHAMALAAFDKLGNTKALIILDNLNEDAVALVGQVNRKHYPSAEKVHLLVTTRADPRALGGMESVSLDTLPTADALDLLFGYRAYARRAGDPDYEQARAGDYDLIEADEVPPNEEWKAALAIVNRLGGHALAVTLVGAYLRCYPYVNYGRIARDMREGGICASLDVAGRDERVRGLVQHPETLISLLLERSIQRLDLLATCILQYSAVLPSGLATVAGLEFAVRGDDGHERLRANEFGSPEWQAAVDRLEGLGLLSMQPLVQLHPLVRFAVLKRTCHKRLEEVEAVCMARCEVILRLARTIVESEPEATQRLVRNGVERFKQQMMNQVTENRQWFSRNYRTGRRLATVGCVVIAFQVVLLIMREKNVWVQVTAWGLIASLGVSVRRGKLRQARRLKASPNESEVDAVEQFSRANMR